GQATAGSRLRSVGRCASRSSGPRHVSPGSLQLESTPMNRFIVLGAALLLGVGPQATAREARLVRYPDFHDGKVAFTYLGDIWLADGDGKGVQRLTVHKARDVYPRFSPDGKLIAFSSDREGNMDVYVIPTAGGAVRRLTVHSADDTVLDWTADGRGIL